MKKFLNTMKCFGLFLWQLPQNIVALVMYPFLGKKELAKKDEYGTRAFYCTKMMGGISLGNYIFINSRMRKPETLAHEFGHCVDSRKFGWLYLFIIGLPSLCWAAFKPKDACYYSFFTEKRANKNAGLEVAINQYGCWPYFPKKEIEEIKEEKEIIPEKVIPEIKIEKQTELPKKTDGEESLSSRINKLARNK